MLVFMAVHVYLFYFIKGNLKQHNIQIFFFKLIRFTSLSLPLSQFSLCLFNICTINFNELCN